MLWATSAVGINGEAADLHITDPGPEFPLLNYAVSSQLRLYYAFLYVFKMDHKEPSHYV